MFEELRSHMPWRNEACMLQLLKPVCSAACVQKLGSPYVATKEPVVPAMKDLHEAMKIPLAATKTLHSQINKLLKERK